MFYENLQPIDDDLEYHIKKYEEIKLEEGKLDKHIVYIKKIIDQLRRRSKAYKLYQAWSYEWKSSMERDFFYNQASIILISFSKMTQLIQMESFRFDSI